MNRKKECSAVTTELTLYQNPCGFNLRVQMGGTHLLVIAAQF